MECDASKRVVVIGAGIVGASLAYHLARKGAEVIVVEAGAIASGVTATSFAWINTTHNGPDPIPHLRSTAIDEYHRLETELPDLQISWTGALFYSPSTSETQQVSDSQPTGTLISRDQIRSLEPNLKNPPRHAVYKAEEGALDAVQATHTLIAGAQAHGAKVLTQTRMFGFTTQDDQVTGVETTAGSIDADVVVLAAGTGTSTLTEMLGVSLPIEASPSIFIRYRSPPGLVNTIISSPAMEVRQNAEGRLIAAEDFLDNTPENQAEAIATRAAKAIQKELHGVTFIEPELACVGLRPMPADGIPIVGPLPNIRGVYVCAMHPGVILAAIVGRLASEEILGDQPVAALSSCRPQRFIQD